MRPASRLSILYGSIRMTLTLDNVPQLSHRRALLLAIFLKIQEVLPDSTASAIFHFDGKKFDFSHDQEFQIKTTQALRTTSDAEKLGFRIRIWRLKKGWTQTDLSKKIGISRTHLSQIEQGWHFPSPKTVRALHKIFFVL